MKLKKFLSLALCACICFAVAAAIPAATEKAAAGEERKYVAGQDYSIEYLLKDFGYEKIGDNDTYLEGRSVKYRLTEDRITGEEIPEKDARPEYSESDPDQFSVTAGYVVNFKRVGSEYTFTVTEGEEERDYTVVTVGKEAVSKIATKYISSGFAAYSAAVADYAKDLTTTSTFNVSKIEENVSVDTIVSNKYYDVTNMKVALYYALPGSSSFSSTSASNVKGLSFSTTKDGVYSFYYIFTDSLGNKDTTDGLVMGNGGFYTDEDGDGVIADTDTLKIPVFTFKVGNITKPEIVVNVAEKAFLNLEYKIDCFAITASNYEKQYKLYFIPEGENAVFDKDSEVYDIENFGDEKYIDAVLSAANVKDVTDDLDQSALTFTPTEKGYYYALLTVYSNENGYSDRVMSYAISAIDEYKEVETEKQFFKYNVTSVIFLSIAALSFIGIIVVLFIKPKQEQQLETKNDVK